MLKFNVITLFPEVFTPFYDLLPYREAIKKQLIDINLINLRDFGLGSRKTVDDKPYSGGPGMILMIEPIYNALKSINSEDNHIVLLSPRGKRFTQQKAQELKQKSEITFICGRYEGVDARVEEMCDELISIGDYVLSGGEAPALSIMESITRLIPGAIQKEESLQTESFNNENIEFPQYTRPEEFKGMKVPEVIISGNHKEIEKWRHNNSKSSVK